MAKRDEFTLFTNHIQMTDGKLCVYHGDRGAVSFTYSTSPNNTMPYKTVSHVSIADVMEWEEHYHGNPHPDARMLFSIDHKPLDVTLYLDYVAPSVETWSRELLIFIQKHGYHPCHACSDHNDRNTKLSFMDKE